MSGERIYAAYKIESAGSLDHAAEVIAGEQSTGTFVAVPGETDELKVRHRARVESVIEWGTHPTPSLPGSLNAASYRRGQVTISFPYDNVGPSIPNLLATMAGNLYELKELSGIRLIDVILPAGFGEKYPGPQFGVAGTRRICDVYDRPIIGTIIKPSVGLKAVELKDLVSRLAEAGIDFIKDDELNADPPYFRLADRVPVVLEAIDRAAQHTGKRVMYAVNITGDLDEMLERHDLVAAHGGNAVMVSINSVGLAALTHLRRHSLLPIHGHRNQWGMMTRFPWLGMDFRVYQKLCRLAGVDHLHTNGLRNKFYESDASVVDSVTALLEPMFGDDTAMPVLSSGQWAGLAEPTYQALNTVDVMHLAGGGILAHPGGIQDGVVSMRQGWEAATRQIPVEQYAAAHDELKAALARFGDLRHD